MSPIQRLSDIAEASDELVEAIPEYHRERDGGRERGGSHAGSSEMEHRDGNTETELSQVMVVLLCLVSHKVDVGSTPIPLDE